MVKRKKIVRQKQKQKQKQSQNVIINIHNLKKKRQASKKIMSRPITTYPIFQESPPPVPIIQLNTPPPVHYYQNPFPKIQLENTITEDAKVDNIVAGAREENTIGENLVTPSKKPLGKKPRKILTREEKDRKNLLARTKRMMNIVG